MTTEITVSPQPATEKTPERDLAPAPLQNRAPLPESAMPTQDLVHLEPKKRQKTYGEKRFDLLTYGGIALVGNEFTSLGITESIKEGRPAHRLYQKFEGLFTKFRSAETSSSLRNYIVGTAEKPAARLPYLLVATLGGMLMVPFVKNREDRKGEIVRKLDRQHYGAQSETDPELVAAHQEMDEAPKQSWGSLWKGRVTTVISAAIADFTFGWPDALTTKLFKNNATYQKYASLERISEVVADKATRAMHISPQNEALSRKILGNGTWLLTLSASLTLLFYASSKMFATRQDAKQHQRNGNAHGPEGDMAENPNSMPDAPAPVLLETAEAPSTTIRHAQHQQTLLAPAQPMLQA